MRWLGCAPVGGGVAVDDGDRHGGGVSGWNFYGGSRRLVYRRGMTTENYALSELCLLPNSFPATVHIFSWHVALR